MRQQLLPYIALMLGLSINAYGAPPSVAVDIAPLHSLVSQVMKEVGKPDLLIPAEASPHNYALRPSDGKVLANADLVFWMGESYTPWLEKALHNVAISAQKVEVLAFEDTITHGYREGATFESHEHEEEESNDKSDHKKEAPLEESKQSKHEKEEHTDHHDHEGSDPHAWLDPENAKRWIKHIKDILSKHDPDNAPIYSRNAAKATASLDELIHSTRTKIDTLNKPKFIVFHDAYQYFEKRFEVLATGAISLGHAQTPSPARIKEIRDTVKKLEVTCVFTEPQYNPGIVNNVFEGTTVSTIGVMDPLGAGFATGTEHYHQLIQGMVNSLNQCQ